MGSSPTGITNGFLLIVASTSALHAESTSSILVESTQTSYHIPTYMSQNTIVGHDNEFVEIEIWVGEI